MAHDTSTDRLTTLSVKELTSPSVTNNSFTLSMVGQYTLTETPKIYVFGGLGSVRTHWEAIALPRSLAIR